MGLSDPILLGCLLTVFLPLSAFALIMIFTRNNAKLSLAISLIASTIPLIIAWTFFFKLGGREPIIYNFNWLVSDIVKVPFGFLLDPTSLVMFVIVATISWLVQIYSIGYMAGDPGFGRFYADLSLFALAMLTLVISSGLLQLYIAWELVGLASYLLIGFWYEKFSASEAGKKAFVVTRFGDIGFFMGLVFLTLFYGSLDIASVNAAAVAKSMPPWLLTTAGLLIFCGIMGKSAQFPLHCWLPDAMEGPTPVSALLHSATMVAAGVYLLTRIFPFFAASATTMSVILAISSLTLILSSTIALVATDIKQVWAYSTISQLGFMAMGLSAAALASGNLFPGYYHLTTHAAFKAMLFLCSGVFIHHFGTNDFFTMATNGGRKLYIPMVCITIAALALAGIFPFAGFFSKEAIMGTLGALDNKLWLGLGLFGAFLTAYYSFRVIFVMLFPKEPEAYSKVPGHIVHVEDEAHGHGGHGDGHDEHHGVPWVMSFPLIVLAFFTLILGFCHDYLMKLLLGEVHHEAMDYFLLISAVSCAVGGIAMAWLDWGRKDAKCVGFISKMPALQTFFIQKWYMDHFWRWFLNRFIYGTFSRLFTLNDRRVVDGGVDAVAFSTVGSGRLLSFIQTAFLQYNLLFMVLVLAGVGIYLLMGL
ncbi:MAG: NADH-quinone oxidoreductase subunit L [Syntrophobacterales bacterium]|jgi:NADH-quinone oxidoreductase subunit L|nr:NADH-quinone oxidoreductase subunit L [Syntrophobacterales bacterium]